MKYGKFSIGILSSGTHIIMYLGYLKYKVGNKCLRYEN